MTFRVNRQKHYLFLHTVLAFAVIFTTALTAAGLSGDRTGNHTFEARLASHDKVEGWKMVPGPDPGKTPLWISPEAALTNADVALAYVDRTPEGKPCLGILFTEEGALKQARLTRSHVGRFVAVMLDGRVAMAARIVDEITGSRAMIVGNFSEEEAESIAEGLSGDQKRKIRVEPGKIDFQLRLASYEKVEGWEIGLVPGPPKTPVWISPEAALTNADIARAWPQADADGFGVGFMLTEEGSLKLARLTKSHIGEILAIMLDGRVCSAPRIMDEITGGRAIISGKFTEEEAGSLAEGILLK